VVPRRGKKESNNNDRVPKNKLLFPSAEGIGASSGQVKGMVLVSVDTSLSEQVVAEYIPAENATPSEGRTVTASAWPAFVVRSAKGPGELAEIDVGCHATCVPSR